MQPNSRNSRLHRRPRSAKMLTSSDRKNSLLYLKSPTTTGIFKFNDFIPNLETLKSDLASLVDSKNRNIAELRQERASRMLDDGVASLLLFFVWLVTKKNGTDEETRNMYFRFDYIFDGINVNSLLTKYKDALTYFEKYIYSKNAEAEYHPMEAIIKVKNGFIVSSTRGRGVNEVISLSREPLERVKEFLILAEVIDNAQIYSVFSPEEELLEPYVDIVSACLENLPVSSTNRRHLRKAISNYYDEDYTGSVSSAGLVAEEYLSQVYETIAREPVPRNLTLGQLSQRIGLTSKAIENPQSTPTRITQASIMRDIEKIRYSSDKTYTRKVVSNILRYMSSAAKELKSDLDSVNKSDQSFALFPKLIKMSMDDLVTYRNIASHKSTESIDSLKALKSLASSLSLAIWWEASRKTIDASKSKEDVYNELVEQAKTYQ